MGIRTSRIFLTAFLLASAVSLAAGARETVDLNKGWIFINPYRSWTERVAQPGDETAFAGRKVDLPHDFSIEGGFDESNPSGTSGGYLPGGKAIYRKNDIFIPEEWSGKKILVEFEGIYQNSTVYVNGVKVGFRPNGWVPVVYDISDWLDYGRENSMAVLVDNSLMPNCRWYTGSGIYRPVRLIVKDNLSIGHFGVYVTVPVVDGDMAAVRVKTHVDNGRDSAQRFDVVQEVFDSRGRMLSSQTGDFYLPKAHSREFEQNFFLENPELWDVDNPVLYTLVTRIVRDGHTVDECETTFGVRSFGFSAGEGFRLNGRSMKLKGVCLHHDGGMTGAAVPEAVWKRRLSILKDMGCNAIRTSHNPFDPSFYDLCDRMGFLVMDEFYDEWTVYTTQRVPYGSHLYWDEWHEKDITDLVKRDRNHPSVIMWSVGNEIIEQGYPQGREIARELVDLVHSLDPTRPVTCGNNMHPEADRTGFTDEFDVAGYNYAPQSGSYRPAREKYPYRKFIGTESTRGKSNRGVYVFPVQDRNGGPKSEGNYFSSYDGLIRKYGQEHEWKETAELDYVSGMFIWTGFDYIGETSFPYPTKYSDYGAADVCGFPKDAYWFYRSVWNEVETTLHLLPHWNWPDRVGKVTPVWCYTDCDEVELFLNGKSLGRKSMEDSGCMHLEWTPEYVPGTLRAVGYKDGRKVKETVVETTGKPAKVHLEADRRVISADGKDVVHIVVSVLDSEGRPVPDAMDALDYTVEGGRLLGIDSGDPQYVGSYLAKEGRKLFNGLALVMVQSASEKETIEVSVSGPGLVGDTLEIRTE